MFLLAPKETKAVSIRLISRLPIALRNGKTVPKWQIHSAVNPSDGEGRVETREWWAGSHHFS